MGIFRGIPWGGEKLRVGFCRYGFPYTVKKNSLQEDDKYLFNCVDKALDTYSNYDLLLAGDFNAEDHEPCLSNFHHQHDLYNLIQVGTFLKNSSKPTPIDLTFSKYRCSMQWSI